MSSLNLLWYSFEPFPCVLSLHTRVKRSAPPFIFTFPPQEAVDSSGSCREQWGHPSVSFPTDCHQAFTSPLAIPLYLPLEMCFFNRHHHGLDSSITQTHCSPSAQLHSYYLTFRGGPYAVVHVSPLGYEMVFPGLFPTLQQWYYLVKGCPILSWRLRNLRRKFLSY